MVVLEIHIETHIDHMKRLIENGFCAITLSHYIAINQRLSNLNGNVKYEYFGAYF